MTGAPLQPVFEPFGNTVILKPIRPEVEEQTPGGLYLPSQVVEAEKTKPISAISVYEVIACGPDAPSPEPGDRVWVKSYVADSFDKEATFVAVSVADIWATVEGV